MKRILGIISSMACLVLLMGQMTVAAEDGAAVFKRQCAGCHGQKAERSTGGTQAIHGQDIQKMLIGYKDGSFGGKQKATMQNVVKKLSGDDIKAVSDFVKGIK